MSLRASGSEIVLSRLAASSLRLLPTRSTACLTAARSKGDVAALVAIVNAGVDRNAGGGMAGAGGGALARPVGLGTDAVARGAPGASGSGAAGPPCACTLCSVALAFGADLIAAGLAGGNGIWPDGCAAQIGPAAMTRTDTKVVSRIGVTSTNPPRHAPAAIRSESLLLVRLRNY